jgi:hypothetical protein
MDFVRRAITESVLAYGPTIACFRGFSIRRDDSGEIPVTETEFGVIDKGSFVVAEMSQIDFEELPPLFIEVSQNYLNNLLWRDLYHRPKRAVLTDISQGTESFWRRVVQEASTVGPDPIVLVPYQTLWGSNLGGRAALSSRGFSGL